MNLHDLWSGTFKRTWPCQTCHVNISLLNSASLSSHSKSLAKNKCHLQYFNCFTCHSADSTANLPFFSCQICKQGSHSKRPVRPLAGPVCCLCNFIQLVLVYCTLISQYQRLPRRHLNPGKYYKLLRQNCVSSFLICE